MNNQWNESIEKSMKSLINDALIHEKMHIEASMSAKKWYNWLMYASIFLGPIGGILDSTIRKDCNNKELTIIDATVKAFLFATGILATCVKFGNFENATILHKTIAMKYKSLSQNINRQLSLPEKDREIAGNYFSWITQMYNDLFDASPLVSDRIFNKYSSKLSSPLSAKLVEEPRKIRSAPLKNTEEIRVDISNKSCDDLSVSISEFGHGRMRYELARLKRSS